MPFDYDLILKGGEDLKPGDNVLDLASLVRAVRSRKSV
jgi:hypothetical protein